jgi:hypothetical protein
MAVFLDAEPLLEVNNPKIAALAKRLRGSDTDPRSWRSGSTAGCTTR